MENTPRLVTGAETEIRANLVIVKEMCTVCLSQPFLRIS